MLGGGGDGNIPCAQQADAGLVMRRNGEGPLADDLRLCRIIAGLGQAEGRPGFADTGVAGQEVLNGLVNTPAEPVRVQGAVVIHFLQMVQSRSGLLAVDGDVPVLIGPGAAHGPQNIVKHTAQLAIDTGDVVAVEAVLGSRLDLLAIVGPVVSQSVGIDVGTIGKDARGIGIGDAVELALPDTAVVQNVLDEHGGVIAVALDILTEVGHEGSKLTVPLGCDIDDIIGAGIADRIQKDLLVQLGVGEVDDFDLGAGGFLKLGNHRSGRIRIDTRHIQDGQGLALKRLCVIRERHRRQGQHHAEDNRDC